MKALMPFFVWMVLLPWLCKWCNGQPQRDTRWDKLPVAAGSFYPADSVELRRLLTSMFQTATYDGTQNLAAILVPHAGYLFSGTTAAAGYAQIERNRLYDRVFVVGTSHYNTLKGASVYCHGSFFTPLGKIDVDTATAQKLIAQSQWMEFAPEVYGKEHCIEVQLPFLQYWLTKPFKVVPIIIATNSPETCRQIAAALAPYFNGHNLFVFSSDFSHYPTYHGALLADNATKEAILTNNPHEFLSAIDRNEKKQIAGLATSCCGWSAVLTAIYLNANAGPIQVNHLRYQNSGDSRYGDTNRVVGYHAFAFTRIHQGTAPVFSPDDKKQLLSIARQAIANQLQNKPIAPDIAVSANLNKKMGVFVTLTKQGQLRGCIGRFHSGDALAKTVAEMALAAAFHDPRFEPLAPHELDEIEIEISVLTPLRKIDDTREIELGKHGIYMVLGNRSGTFLPQVARDTGWTLDELLGHCARDKAGIGWDGWKKAELYTYEAVVFGEKEPSTPKK